VKELHFVARGALMNDEEEGRKSSAYLKKNI
jgi:hypothetical protein